MPRLRMPEKPKHCPKGNHCLLLVAVVFVVVTIVVVVVVVVVQRATIVQVTWSTEG